MKSEQAEAMAQVCLDMHAALGIKWGDDPYARIKALTEFASGEAVAWISPHGLREVAKGYSQTVQMAETSKYCVPLYAAPRAEPTKEALVCDTCKGSGQVCFERSGSDIDGNAPIFERCPECGYGDEPKASRRVVCAAIRSAKGAVLLGIRHYSADMREQIGVRMDGEIFEHRHDEDQGFVDQHGVFMSREEAYQVALAAGQIVRPEACGEGLDGKKLYSEGLY